VTRRGVRRLLLVAVLGLAVAMIAGPAAGSPPHTALYAQVPYDVEAIRAELAVDGVAVHRSGVDRQGLVRVVTDARHVGLQLSVVVLPDASVPPLASPSPARPYPIQLFTDA
jgi:hypothetical protein